MNPSSLAPRVDVVTVPDFSNPARRAGFTARALFFLASWGEYAGTARDHWRVHLVCVGEVPACVRALADEVGARIEVAAPLSIGRSVNVNKLRGLEIAPESRIGERFFLLDTDIFFLGDPRPLVDEMNIDVVSAAPSSVKRVPESYWKRIYAALQLPEPSERIALLDVELGLWNRSFIEGRGANATDLRAMRPYWNGGVVLCPWRAPLRELWAAHLAVIYDTFAPPRNAWEKSTLWLLDPARAQPKSIVSTSDMAGLATSFEALKRQGFPFERLPDVLHARKSHLQAGTMNWNDPIIWHGASFCRGVRTWSDFPAHFAKFNAQMDALLEEGAARRGEVSSTKASEWFEDLWERRIAPIVAKYPPED